LDSSPPTFNSDPPPTFEKIHNPPPQAPPPGVDIEAIISAIGANLHKSDSTLTITDENARPTPVSLGNMKMPKGKQGKDGIISKRSDLVPLSSAHSPTSLTILEKMTTTTHDPTITLSGNAPRLTPVDLRMKNAKGKIKRDRTDVSVPKHSGDEITLVALKASSGAVGMKAGMGIGCGVVFAWICVGFLI
jgi:hypothetical protein